MNAKKEYLKEAEVKMKNTLSDLYKNESKVLAKLLSFKESFTAKIDELELNYNSIIEQREALHQSFENLKSSGDAHWEIARDDFEDILKAMESNQEHYFINAELFMQKISDKVNELEEKAVNASQDIKKDLYQSIDELKGMRNEIQAKVDSIKSSSDTKWNDLKQWFVKKSHDVKAYISTLGN